MQLYKPSTWKYDQLRATKPHVSDRWPLELVWQGDRQAPAQRLVVPIAALVAVFTFALLQYLHGLVAQTGADFRAVLQAAAALSHGQDVYTPALQFLQQGDLRRILSMTNTPYVYPPPLAILVQPLTLLPARAALLIWDGLNVGMLTVLFVLIARISRVQSMLQLVLIGVVYGFFPMLMGLGNGQIDLTITVLCLLTYVLYRSDRQLQAGVVLGLIALIKPTVGIILLYFVFRRAWPLVHAFIAAVAVGIGLSLVAVGTSVLWEYRTVAAGWANAFGVLPLNQSVHGEVSRLLAPALDMAPTGMSGMFSLCSEIALPFGTALIAWRLLRRAEPVELRLGLFQYYAAFSLLLLGIPFTENMHLSWLLPGMGLLFAHMAQDRSWHPWHAGAVLAYLVLALPFAEWISWRAGATLLGRLSSGLDLYALIALCAVFCTVAFGKSALPSGKKPRQLRALSSG